MPPSKKQPAVILPADNVVKDGAKVSWRIGRRIGQGGFGQVFLCDRDTGGRAPGDDSSSAYVIKIEPSGSGPLFVEMHCYMRVAGADQIAAWVARRKLDYLGMPVMHSKGTYEAKGVTYRYIVIDRFGGDFEAIWQRHKTADGVMPAKTALTTGVRVLDVLEYLHENSYVHADVKASNIMLGRRDPNKVYLVDFGLACKFESNGGEHKAEKQDKKKMHNGTIEYTSRDAHRGMESRRADIEILGYNLLHWLSGTLPWLGCLKDCKAVAAAKEKHAADVKTLVTTCFGRADKTMLDFMTLVEAMDFSEKPNYDRLRQILKDGVALAGFKYDGKIDAGIAAKPTKSAKPTAKSRKRLSQELGSDDEELAAAPKKAATSPARRRNARKPPTERGAVSVNSPERNAAAGGEPAKGAKSTAAVAAAKAAGRKAVGAKPVKKATAAKATAKSATAVLADVPDWESSSSSSLENMTPAMKEVWEMKQRKAALKKKGK